MDNAREVYMEYQTLSQKVKQIQEYLEATTENVTEITNIIHALQELEELKTGENILAPIANGIFVEATLNNASTVRLNVGSGVTVEKKVPEAVKMLERQRADLESLRERASEDHQQTLAKLKELEQQVDA